MHVLNLRTFRTLTVIQPTVVSIEHPKALPTPRIAVTAMVIWIIQLRAKMNVRKTMNPIQSHAVVLKLRKSQTAALLVLH
jgi:hypothetical protein